MNIHLEDGVYELFCNPFGTPLNTLVSSEETHDIAR